MASSGSTAWLEYAVGALAGKVCLQRDGVAYVLESVSGNEKCRLVGNGENGPDAILVSAQETVKAFMKLHGGGEGSASQLGEEGKTFIQEWVEAGVGAFKKIQRQQEVLRVEQKRRASVQKKIRREKQLSAAQNRPPDADDHTLPSLQAKLDTSKQRTEAAKRKIEELKSESAKFGFTTPQGASKLFHERLGVKVHGNTIRQWMSGARCTSLKGRKTKLDESAEDAILETVLHADRVGLPYSRKELIELVSKAVKNEWKPTTGWVQRWLNRMKGKAPTLVEAVCRGEARATLKWFNTKNINWWFDCFVKLVQEHGFARKPVAGEPGEVIWLTPERVIITDETAVSGERESRAGLEKQLTTIENLDKSGKRSRGVRRVPVQSQLSADHITLVGGHNLCGELTVPVWVVKSTGQIQKKTREHIEEVAPKYPQLPKINGREMNTVHYGASTTGSIREDNIEELMVPAIVDMFPDVANEDGKRVLWLTEMHGSRLAKSLLDSLEEKGIVLIGWLPNCTSKCQSPDTDLFGPFKKALREKKAEWSNDNSGRADRVQMIGLAGETFIDICKPSLCLQGARRTGMQPVDRKVLLDHPSIKTGDVMALSEKARIGAERLEQLQLGSPLQSPRSSVASIAAAPKPVTSPVHVTPVPLMSSSSSSSSGDFSSGAISTASQPAVNQAVDLGTPPPEHTDGLPPITTPECKGYAEQVFLDTTSQRKMTLGRAMTLSKKAALGDAERKKIRDELEGRLNSAILKFNQEYPAQLLRHDIAIDRDIDRLVAEKEETDAKRSLVMFEISMLEALLTAKKQEVKELSEESTKMAAEIATMKADKPRVKRNYEASRKSEKAFLLVLQQWARSPDVNPMVLANIMDELDHLEATPRDDVGRPVRDAAFLGQSTLPLSPALHAGALMQEMSSRSNTIAAMSGGGKKRKSTDSKRQTGTWRKCRTGTNAQGADQYDQHAADRAQQQAINEEKRQEKKRRVDERSETLLQRLGKTSRAAQEELKRSVRRRGVMSPWLSVLREKALADGNMALADRVKELQTVDVRQFREQITAFAQQHLAIVEAPMPAPPSGHTLSHQSLSGEQSVPTPPQLPQPAQAAPAAPQLASESLPIQD
ncbi:Hypothetical protein (Fragment) [Durusdinium trenchii]|uniref:HTH CENPB-type domain-containing protein n=1 Tax=Durusdinium trenchii TaxID=1381693 RepID=A0ABP0HXQ9_9DINO